MSFSSIIGSFPTPKPYVKVVGNLWGMEIICSPSVPEDEVWLVSDTETVVARISKTPESKEVVPTK